MLLRRFSQTLRVSIALIVAVFSAGIVPVTSAYAAQPNDPGQPPVTAEQKEKMDKKETTVITMSVVPLPPAPNVQDDCGANNATWVVPDNAVDPALRWELDQNGKLSVALLTENSTFSDGKTVYDFGKAKEDNVTPCEVDTEQKPLSQETINESNDTIPAPQTTTVNTGSTETLNIVSTGTKEIIDTPTDGKITICHSHQPQPSPGGGQGPQDNPYNTETISVEAANGGNDNGDHYLEHTGSVFTPGASSWGDIIPPIPDSANTTGLNWTTYGKAIYYNGCKPVTTVEPDVNFSDLCGDEYDRIRLDQRDGITYEINGTASTKNNVAAPNGLVTVTAEADTGYVIKEGSLTTWTHTFTDDDCVDITKTGAAPVDTTGDGKIGVGDRITWTITVKNTAQTDFEYLDVTVTDPGATFVGESSVSHLAPGDTATFTAYTTLSSANFGTVCQASNTANFSAAYSMTNGEAMLQSREAERPEFSSTGSASALVTFTCPSTGQVLGQSINLGGGRGAGQVLAASTAALPAELPSTGNASNPMMILLAALIAYGAAYFLQGRRLIGRNLSLSA